MMSDSNMRLTETGPTSAPSAGDGSCPVAGYDQPGKSHYCLDCSRHWYGDESGCIESGCPFRSRAALVQS